MSLDIEARLREFLASAPQTIYMIEVISIAHSDLTQTYHLWREPSNGGVVDENDNFHRIHCHYSQLCIHHLLDILLRHILYNM